MIDTMLARLQKSVEYSAHHARHNARMVGWLGIITFPTYYFVWHYFFPQPYENFTLRAVGMALCIPLFFYQQWPTRLVGQVYWHWMAALLYTLPFFFTYMLLRNDLNLVWSMSTLAALFLLVIAVNDWLLVILLYITGSLLAWVCFAIGGDVDAGVVARYLQQLPIYIFVVVAGGTFNHSSNMLKEERLNAHAAVGRNIAHELRTPLAGMKGATNGLIRFLPDLVNAQRLAEAANLPVRRIRAGHLDQLSDVARSIRDEIDYANTIIDMLLLSAEQSSIKTDNFTFYGMHDTVRHALERFPFNSSRDRALVNWEGGEDFRYFGSNLLMTHVLFNLIKNALHSINQAGRGEIMVRTATGPQYNTLTFMDTGPGIAPEALKHIFDYFYTSNTVDQGNGLGLSFCKLVMESLGGRIACESVQGQFTLFEMRFPKEPAT